MNFIKRFDQIKENEIELVGGKALSLGRLIQANLPVPPGYVITTEAYRSLKSSSISSEFETDILKSFDELGAERVAVRSSAIAEDSPDASWAGQFESYLNVDRDQLLESIKKCWQSASSELVEAYAESQSTSNEQLAIAVVIQKMIDSDVSGVAFSVNPISKNDDELMVEAIYGLGELLVQGMVTPDNYIVAKTNFEIIEKQVKTKSTMLIYQDGENIEQRVPETHRDESCLDNNQLIELSKLIIKVEQYYDKPQDVEWALENNSFYLVQSRPITTL